MNYFGYAIQAPYIDPNGVMFIRWKHLGNGVVREFCPVRYPGDHLTSFFDTFGRDLPPGIESRYH